LYDAIRSIGRVAFLTTNNRRTMMKKLTKKEITKAIARYARRHGYYARTVREVDSLWKAAIAEYRAKP